MLNKKGTVDYEALADAMGAAGGDSAFSSASNPGVVFGTNAQWSQTNPQGAVAGILAMRNGQGSGGISMNAYLRRDGSLPMLGNLNMGAQSITNSTNITATGTVAAGTVNASNGSIANLTSTTTATTNATVYGTATVSWENAGTVNTTNLNASNIGTSTLNVSGSEYANYLTAANIMMGVGQTLNFGNTNTGVYGDGNNMALRAPGATFIQTPWGSDGVLNTGDINASRNINANSINSNTTAANYILSNGRIVAGEYMQVNGYAGAGGGCAPNGLIGQNGAGSPLFCTNGVWASVGGNYGGQYVLREYLNSGQVLTDGTGCQTNPMTNACSCPPGYGDYEYSTGQSYAYKEWDSIYRTHFCFRP
jgi:hypothetical protein